MTKIGRNDRCHCGSTRKYKVCCLFKDEDVKKQEDLKYSVGQSTFSDKIQECIQHYTQLYPDHTFINITDDLNNANYKTYQLRNYTNDIIMLAERTNNNETVFSSRGQDTNDIIVMFRGSYRTFDFANLSNADTAVHKMITTRLAGKNDSA